MCSVIFDLDLTLLVTGGGDVGVQRHSVTLI